MEEDKIPIADYEQVRKVRAATLSIKAGDIFVLMYEQAISEDTVARIKHHMESLLPEGVKTLILGDGAKIAVLQPKVADSKDVNP